MGVGGGEGGGEWSRDRLIKSFECGGERGLFKGPCTVEKKEDNNRVFFFQYRQKRERERERERKEYKMEFQLKRLHHRWIGFTLALEMMVVFWDCFSIGV